jgi:hypothetical protein
MDKYKYSRVKILLAKKETDKDLKEKLPFKYIDA